MSDAAAEVLAAAEARSRALAARDADALRALLHPDLVWASPRGDVLSRDGYLAANVESGTVVWHGQRLEHASVVVRGDTGVVVCDAVDDVERDGVRGTHRFRVTFTWVREDGAWRLLAGAVGPKLGG